MTEGLASTFVSSLDALDVGWTIARSDEFDDVLDEVLEPPVVGAPFPFDELSLPDHVTIAPTPDELRAAATGVTAAGAGIAEYGTLLVQSRPGGDEPVSLYPERHVAIVRESDLVAGVPEAMERLGTEFDDGRTSAVFATGISATADMGATVYGVHGPREVHVIVISDR